jgi:hypothetical protein
MDEYDPGRNDDDSSENDDEDNGSNGTEPHGFLIGDI